ncbi:MAG: hypothetical protein GSR84_04755 [Desulfurococcales archaeon]|nr:hypothetical protein [Desulfurococcales archaeon]
MQPVKGASIVAAAYLLLITILVPYSLYTYTPHKAMVLEVNGDPILYSGDWIVVSNMSGTWIKGPDGWVREGYRAVDACTLDGVLYVLSSRDPYIIVYHSDGATAYSLPANMPRPRAIACGPPVAAIGGDSVRGTVLYIIGDDVVHAYPLPGAPQGFEDLGVYNSTIIAVKDSLLLEARPQEGYVRLLNLTTPEWRVDLDLVQGDLLLGSLRRDPSRLALVAKYPSMEVQALEVVGRAAIMAAHTGWGDRMLSLVRPAGAWALLVEWSPSRVYRAVSTVMSDAYTLTATGSTMGGVWQGGRLLGGMKAILVESTSATPGLVGEGYRIVVNMDKYKGALVVHGGLEIEPVEAEASPGLGDPLAVAGKAWGGGERVDVPARVYGVDRDPVSLFLALAALSIPSWLLISRVLEG